MHSLRAFSRMFCSLSPCLSQFLPPLLMSLLQQAPSLPDDGQFFLSFSFPILPLLLLPFFLQNIYFHIRHATCECILTLLSHLRYAYTSEQGSTGERDRRTGGSARRQERKSEEKESLTGLACYYHTLHPLTSLLALLTAAAAAAVSFTLSHAAFASPSMHTAFTVSQTLHFIKERERERETGWQQHTDADRGSHAHTHTLF